MISVKNIRSVAEKYDEIWAIVRNMKFNDASMKQITTLSPSKELFFKYRDMVKRGTWNQKSFQEIYVPIFIQEIIGSKSALRSLNELYLLDKAGREIYLVRFCQDETICHRSIIAGLLQGVGCNVTTETGIDYTTYYKQYIELKKRKLL